MGIDMVEGYCNIILAIKNHATINVAEEGNFGSFRTLMWDAQE